ncbi:Translocon-associated protein subunit delta [Labeo rohita]|uniref:Translocon-associated protein subunit delta n=1 Tax=Labeo rohita TaxID=84645 RepID=A0ABQ8LGN7_LABRO|nr:Translocon-associated protein subunit delta [Labeo rohita]
MMRIVTAILALSLSLCAAETCTDPVISPSSYTTTDALISSETVFIVELSLACANGAQSVALYADVNGKQFPVSWSVPHKQASSGTYQGAWSGPWVSTEVLAALIGIVVYYLAYSTKSAIQA